MRTTLIVTLCSLLSLFGGAAVTAQKRSCPAPPPSPFKHSGQIVTSFDPSANGMRTTLKHPRPLSGAQSGLYLGASFVHQNTKWAASRSVELFLLSSSKEYRYRDAHELTLLRDGKPIAFAAPGYQSSVDGHGMVVEVLRVRLSLEDLASLTGARRVRTKVGAEEFELTTNHLEALRELVSLMGNTSSRWRAE